jgi:hypothetical protein
MYQNQVNTGPGSVLTPPVQSCPGGQTLVNWTGSWFCYFTDEIYPAGGNSPETAIPPSGRGGEYCTSVGMNFSYYGYGYNQMNNGYNSNYMTNMYVVCSPGYRCMAANGTNTVNNGYNNGYYNGYNTYGTGYGQSGSCVLTGYYGN